jgi:serine/threonine protein kinase
VTGVAAEVGSTANNYQILARLAVGGMAEIFLARGISTTGVERYCVLKRILRERATDVHFVRMFLDEARLAAQLQHPNVAQVYDIGKLGDSYFFTMEYVHGETVRALLHRARTLRRELPLNIALSLAAGAAAGLHHAHERLGHDGRPLGIVHRDISPSNLMVSYEGTVKVVDFGVAKAENRAQETRSGTVKGKIAYLSPEQCRGVSIDRRSDLYSLGIVFWEMLTVERLYKRASDFDNMTAIVTEAPIPPSVRRPNIPPELDAISMRLLAKDPAARFQTADELVDALEEVSVKTGAMISTSALGRFMRELFGQRPEPWLELDLTQPAPPVEGVTITTGSLPGELAGELGAGPTGAGLDAQLAAVPTLPHPAQLSGPLTAPTVSAQPPRQTTLYPPPIPPRAAMSSQPPPIAPGVGSYSGAQPVIADGYSQSQVDQDIERPSRIWPLVAIVAAAAVVGSVTVYLVMRGGTDVVIRDSAVATLAPADAAAVAESADADVVVQAPSNDAAPLVVDAAVAVSVDAAIPVDAAPAVKPPPVTKSLGDEIKVAAIERRHADVVALCAKSTEPDHLLVCTVSACHEHLEARAKAWLAKLPAPSKRFAITQCHDLGVELVPKAKPPTPPNTPRVPTDGGVDPCVANPMACQR